MPFKPASDALSSIRVLDLARVRSGPTAVRQLADWGADVIKIESPPSAASDEGMGGPRHGPDFQNLHRNKRSLTLDLKSEEGLQIFRRLVETADVVVENFRPDVKHRLGIGYEDLQAINPRLVYASISGFGQTGPYAGRPGFDQIAQGMGGLMSITGAPGNGPMRVGIPITDLAAGLYCALGIMVALLARGHTGRGQWVQTSLLQAQIALLDFQAARWLMNGEIAGQAGNNHPTNIPTGVFRTSDGTINVAVTGNDIWSRFCEVLGRPQWLTDPRFATAANRLANRDALNDEIEALLSQEPQSEWVARFNKAGVPAGIINRIDQVFADPQVRHLEMAAPVHSPALGDIELVAQPITMSEMTSRIVLAPPEIGEHTDEILGELGFTHSDCNRLRQRGVI
jgi:crotonobetainyl-CoA:carnitine CoA-transferase CaiB-like acyl-CoA transferase